MSDKTNFKWHSMALSAIFVLGNGVINLPAKNADEFTFAAFLVSVLLMLAVYLMAKFLAVFFVDVSCRDSMLKRITATVFLCAISVFSAFCAAHTFKEFINFVSQVILPRTAEFFVVSFFAATVIYFGLKRQENILKFCLVSFVLTVSVILFFFFAPIDEYDLRNIFIFRLPDFKELYTQIKPYFINTVLSTLILPLYFFFALGRRKTKKGLAGVIIGAVLLGLCVLMPVLLFGPFLAGKLDFPFSSAVSTVTVGRLFTRLDGFSYFVYFVCSLIKITVCLFVTFSSLKKIDFMMQIKSRNF